MSDDIGWEKIVDAIDAKFGVDRHGRETKPLEDRADLTQTVAFIEFTRSGEDYRFERISRPSIMDKRSIYHKAATGGIRYENVYDTDNTTHLTKLYRKSGESWQAIEMDELAL